MTSLCLTIKNEKLLPVIREVARQSILPDETVIVVSGEKSSEKIKEDILKKLHINIHYYKSNRSQGRNKAANLASHENLIFVDSGCVFDKNLIKLMTSSLVAKNAQIVAGRYQSEPKKFSEYLFSKFMNKDLESVDVFYPSARNFGIKKRIFEKLNGFRESLETAEDTEFFKRAVDEGFVIKKNTKAVVTWDLPNLKKYIIKIFSYAKGDASSDIWWDKRKKFATHNIKHTLCLFRWSIVILLFLFGFTHFGLFLLTVYFLSVAFKHKIEFWRFTDNNLIVMVLNIVEYVIIKTLTDFSATVGFVIGMF